MSCYVAKSLNQQGEIDWSEEEHSVWHDLVARQQSIVGETACQPYLDGLDLLALSADRVPRLSDLNHTLDRETGWQIAPVPALISFDHFFALLADKKFPAATFLRSRQEFDYLQEPDFFHEIYGHCAMLTHPDFAAFTHRYGQLGKSASPKARAYLARLYWFTVEFGLVKEQGVVKIYGGGILSSPAETRCALDKPDAQHRRFDLLQILRTPYRIDHIQPVYYVLEEIGELYSLSQLDLMHYVEQAMALGLLPAPFTVKEENYVG